MPQIDVNGITIEYDRTGSGEPLLLVMGLGAQMTAWPVDFVSMLAGHGFEVIRFDNRVAGLSSESDWIAPSPLKAFVARMLRRPIATGYVIEDMAGDAAGLLDALEIDSAHVVGASMGGMIAQAMAIHHGHKVRSLTSIMSNPGDGSGNMTARTMLTMARRGNPSRENAVDQSIATFRAISGPNFDEAMYRPLAEAAVARSYRPDGLARQTAAIMASPDRTPGLERLDIPTLVVHGLVDPLVQSSGGVATARAVPGSRLLMFNDMGHDLPAVRLPEIAEAIALNAQRARSRSVSAR